MIDGVPSRVLEQVAKQEPCCETLEEHYAVRELGVM